MSKFTQSAKHLYTHTRRIHKQFFRSSTRPWIYQLIRIRHGKLSLSHATTVTVKEHVIESEILFLAPKEATALKHTNTGLNREELKKMVNKNRLGNRHQQLCTHL